MDRIFREWRVLILLGLILLFGSTLSSRADPAPTGLNKAFSADVTLFRKMEGTTIKEKVYRDGDKVRIETEDANGTQTIIFRRDLKAQYAVFSQQNLVVESPWGSSRFYTGFPAGAEFPKGEMAVVGPAVVDGISCQKYQTQDDITNPGLEIFLYWENATTKAPVQVADREESFFTKWKNYVPGPQDPVLFEPPPGYSIRRIGLP